MDFSSHALLTDLRTNREFLLAMLDQPIVFHKVYKKITGSVTAALMLSYATQVSDELEPARGGWFTLDAEAWEEETGLTRKEQITARRRLRELGLFEERKQGMPAHMEFRVNYNGIAELLHRYAELLATTVPTGSGAARKQPERMEHE